MEHLLIVRRGEPKRLSADPEPKCRTHLKFPPIPM